MIVVCVKQGIAGCWPHLGHKYIVESYQTKGGNTCYKFTEFNISSPNLDNFKEISEIRDGIINQLLQ